MNRIRKGDEVIVIAGRDKGRRGTVLRVFEDERVLVEDINVVKKHQKPESEAGVPGGIVEKEMPLHASNVMLWNPVDQEGRSGRHPHARGRQKGALLQVEQRGRGRLTASG